MIKKQSRNDGGDKQKRGEENQINQDHQYTAELSTRTTA